MDMQELTRLEQELEGLLSAKFGRSKAPLAKRLPRIGRRLPGFARAAGEVLITARPRLGHPKLAMQVDAAEVKRAHRVLKAHLEGIDVKDRRKGAVLSLLGSLSISLIGVVAILILVLIWRGFL